MTRKNRAKLFIAILTGLLLFLATFTHLSKAQNKLDTAYIPPKGEFEVIGDTNALANITNSVTILDYFWYRLWNCESSYMADVVHMDSDNLLAYGPVQFKMATFNSFGKQYNLPHDDILSPVQQRAIWERMLHDGYAYLWGCAKTIGMDKYKDI